MDSQDEIYGPLNRKRREFRLIRVLHDDGNEVNCELATHSTTTAPPYKALSYCWTEKLPTCKITLDGHEFLVRPNLHEYLKQVKVECDSSLIFIDALCINQADENERSSQVSLMGDIYRKAEEVVAWLGVGVKDVDDTTMDLAMPRLQSLVGGGSDRFTHCRTDSERELVEQLFCAMGNFEYWSRLWIFQEIVLARELVLQFRAIRLSPDDLLQLGNSRMSVGIPGHFCRVWDPVHRRLTLRLIQDSKRSNGRISSRARLNGLQEWLGDAYSAMIIEGTFLNIRDRLQNDSRGECAMYLKTAFSSLASQICSRTYDSIFGLLGVTNSQLRGGYNMQIIVLYLRALLEGTLEPGAMDEERHGYEEGSFADEQRRGYCGTLRFYTLLMLRLGLPWYDPVVVLATVRALRVLSQRYGFVLPAYIEIIAEVKRRLRNSRPRNHFQSGTDSICLQAIQARLQYHRLSGVPISAPKRDGPSKTYEEWIEWFDEIFRNVELRTRYNPNPVKPWVSGLSTNYADDDDLEIA